MSVIGFAAAWAALAALAISASFSAPSTNAAPASGTKSGVGATAASTIRAAVHFVFAASRTTDTPAPATAMSISLRGMKRRYAAPELAFGGGNLRLTKNSPLPSAFLPGPVQNFSTGNSRVPPDPAITHTPSSAIIGGMESAAGEELHRLPPSVALL